MIKQGDFINVHGKVVIAASQFNGTVTKNLVDGATATLKKFGIKSEGIDIYWVPDAFEIGSTAKKIPKANKYTGIMTLGAVIKGETDHYTMIINNVTSAVMQLNLEGQIPITFSMLITENIEQAVQRAGLKTGNEGSTAVQTLPETMSLSEQITK